MDFLENKNPSNHIIGKKIIETQQAMGSYSARSDAKNIEKEKRKFQYSYHRSLTQIRGQINLRVINVIKKSYQLFFLFLFYRL